MMWGWYGNGFNWGWMGLMMLGGLLLFGLLIWLLVHGTQRQRGYQPQDGPKTQPDEPIEILRQRLAAGEITADEFDRIKAKILK